ncbi:MAG: carboxypeptidase M32 [Chloroflexi bacterium]|nr:carboxypeptidase M32 [Chloroflexota bacterium]
MQSTWNDLKTRLAQVTHLRHASAVLGWDQETYMPENGAGARAEQLALVNKIAHELFVAPEVGNWLAELQDASANLDFASDEASLIRVTRREYDKLRRVPAELVEEISRVSSLGIETWKHARAESNFKLFESDLEKMVGLQIQLANHLGYAEKIYDALLDQYEPEMTARQVAAIFATLKPELVALGQKINARSDAVDDACLRGAFDEQAQWDFGLAVIRQFGFDFESGRQDKSAHPFTTRLGRGDTRITTRVDKNFLGTALFGTLHECGHALYDLGFRRELEGTLLADGASLGVHESQSRLWENLIGRSRGFWKYFFPELQRVFPTQLRGQTVESFYRAINKVNPSLIRVEADEVTYNLHIMMRFELENNLVERKLKVADVPEAWNAKMEEYLGVVPKNDAEGCLQDIHWAFGDFGYFPTYALGNLFSVQLYAQAQIAIPQIPAQIVRGEFADLLSWLRTQIHQHGKKFTLDELANRVTGAPLNAHAYLRYLREKYGEIYGIA